jgi:hypothetical protein
MTTFGYISDHEETFKGFWPNFQHNGVAAFNMLGRSPVPSALSANDLPTGRTQAWNECRMTSINCQAAKINQNSVPESTSDIKNWLQWNEDLDSSTDSEDNWDADNESEIDLLTFNRDSATLE